MNIEGTAFKKAKILTMTEFVPRVELQRAAIYLNRRQRPISNNVEINCEVAAYTKPKVLTEAEF